MHRYILTLLFIAALSGGCASHTPTPWEYAPVQSEKAEIRNH
jgi:hypothetical protein